MIKVNLMRNRVQDPALNAQVGGGGGGEDSNRDSIVKIIVMGIFVCGLMLYEGQNIRNLNAESARLNGQLNQTQSEAAAKAQEVEAVKDVEQEARELEDKLKIMKLLSRLRLREVKTLDFMQSSIPEKVWLRGMTYESDGQKFERGHYQFNGNSVSTEDLSEFVKRLEDSAYLNEVIVVKNQESQVAGKAGSIREFQFTAEVEQKN